MRNTSLLFLLSASLLGCATDGSDSAGPGGSGGGKADGDEGLHVEARVTKLSDVNEIRWPHAVDPGSTADDIINLEFNFEQITGENLDEIKRRWESGTEEVQQGVVAADFEVTANMRNVLSVAINYETIYAYPDFHFAYLNFDSNLGSLIQITNLLDESALPTIAAKLDTELQARIAQLKVELAADIQSGDVDAAQWDGLHVTAADLAQFSTTPDGITFHYDPGFPHAIQALEPDGEFKVSLEDLDAHISERGLWANEY